MQLSKKISILFLLTFFVILWIIYFLNKDFFQLETFFSNLEFIQNFISQNYLLSIFTFLILYSFLILCNFPFASLLSMINGFLFGTWIGGTISLIGGTLGAFGIFIIAKFFFSDFIKNKFLNKYSYIDNYFNKKVGTLSFGETKKLEFLRLIIENKKVWILDEPLSNLDEDSIELMKQTFEDHSSKEGSIIFSSHQNPGIYVTEEIEL